MRYNGFEPPSKEAIEEFKNFLITFYSYYYQKKRDIEYIINDLLYDEGEKDNLTYVYESLRSMLDYVKGGF
jgi:hypothetical protein